MTDGKQRKSKVSKGALSDSGEDSTDSSESHVKQVKIQHRRRLKDGTNHIHHHATELPGFEGYPVEGESPMISYSRLVKLSRLVDVLSGLKLPTFRRLPVAYAPHFCANMSPGAAVFTTETAAPVLARDRQRNYVCPSAVEIRQLPQHQCEAAHGSRHCHEQTIPVRNTQQSVRHRVNSTPTQHISCRPLDASVEHGTYVVQPGYLQTSSTNALQGGCSNSVFVKSDINTAAGSHVRVNVQQSPPGSPGAPSVSINYVNSPCSGRMYTCDPAPDHAATQCVDSTILYNVHAGSVHAATTARNALPVQLSYRPADQQRSTALPAHSQQAGSHPCPCPATGKHTYTAAQSVPSHVAIAHTSGSQGTPYCSHDHHNPGGRINLTTFTPSRPVHTSQYTTSHTATYTPSTTQGSTLMYDQTTGILLNLQASNQSQVLRDLAGQGHVVISAEAACCQKVGELQAVINQELAAHKNKLEQQLTRLELRGGEVSCAAQAAAYEAQTLAQSIVTRVKTVEASKLSELTGLQGQVRLQLESLQGLIQAAQQLCGQPSHPAAFLPAASLLLQDCRRLATQVVPQDVPVTVDDMPQDAKQLQGLQQAYEELSNLLEVKDAMIWKLLKDRDELKAQLVTVTAKYNNELEDLDKECLILQHKLSLSEAVSCDSNVPVQDKPQHKE